MQTVEAFDKERLEVDAVLASGIFNRAPNLAHLLKYVCGKYFDGLADEIKEYNIAVDALGRRPEFDQKKDSIVRVEAHRLRKRLKEYYETEGARHELQIEIPSGQYTPRFVAVILEEAVAVHIDQFARIDTLGNVALTDETAVVPASHAEPVVIAGAEVPVQTRRKKWFVLPGIALCVAGAALFAVPKSHPSPVSANVFPAVLPGDEIRILCGVESGSYTDAFERTWQSDRFYTGGTVVQSPRNQVIWGTHDAQIYRSRREGNFQYDIPVKPGVYELRLYFAETMFGDNNAAGGGETTRLFQVRLNGKALATDFDVIADAGSSSMADTKVYKDVSPAADGRIHLEFVTGTNTPFLNAIAIQPGVSGRVRPYRIAARDHGLTDNQGVRWDPDYYARGGQLIPRPNSNVQTTDPELFRGERYGNISYTLPVAPGGKYTVNLYFAENWFGQGNPGGGGIGSRTFDILINGEMLKRNFDILKAAGGNNRAAIVSEHGVEPNHQGKIVISLVPNQNYACINALEVIDESI